MNYSRYDFTAIISTHNISEQGVKMTFNCCIDLFKDAQQKRRSPKHWTKYELTHCEPVAKNDVNGIIRFVIRNANSVRELKKIEGKLNEEFSKKPFRYFILDVSCTHVKVCPT